MTTNTPKIVKTVYLTIEHRHMMELLCYKNDITMGAAFEEALDDLFTFYSSPNRKYVSYYHDTYNAATSSNRHTIKIEPKKNEQLKTLQKNIKKKEKELIFEAVELILKKYDIQYSEIVPVAKKISESIKISRQSFYIREDQIKPLKQLVFFLQKAETDLLAEALQDIIEKYKVIESLEKLQPITTEVVYNEDGEKRRIKRFVIIEKRMVRPFTFLYIQLNRTNSSIIREALDDLFVKYKTQLAQLNHTDWRILILEEYKKLYGDMDKLSDEQRVKILKDMKKILNLNGIKDDESLNIIEKYIKKEISYENTFDAVLKIMTSEGNEND